MYCASRLGFVALNDATVQQQQRHTTAAAEAPRAKDVSYKHLHFLQTTSCEAKEFTVFMFTLQRDFLLTL